jgi:hypothetical protein
MRHWSWLGSCLTPLAWLWPSIMLLYSISFGGRGVPSKSGQRRRSRSVGSKDLRTTPRGRRSWRAGPRWRRAMVRRAWRNAPGSRRLAKEYKRHHQHRSPQVVSPCRTAPTHSRAGLEGVRQAMKDAQYYDSLPWEIRCRVARWRLASSAPCNGRFSTASAPPSSPAPPVRPSALAPRSSGAMSERQPRASSATTPDASGGSLPTSEPSRHRLRRAGGDDAMRIPEAAWREVKKWQDSANSA